MPQEIVRPPCGEVLIHLYKDNTGSQHYRTSQVGPSSLQSTNKVEHLYRAPQAADTILHRLVL